MSYEYEPKQVGRSGEAPPLPTPDRDRIRRMQATNDVLNARGDVGVATVALRNANRQADALDLKGGPGTGDVIRGQAASKLNTAKEALSRAEAALDVLEGNASADG